MNPLNYVLLALSLIHISLAIALSTTFFKDRWSKSDRNAGLRCV